MRVAICDEEKESCAQLGQLVRRQEPDCEVMCFYSVGQFLEARRHFDILLLDIQMRVCGEWKWPGRFASAGKIRY